jgi:hypothetical protein
VFGRLWFWRGWLVAGVFLGFGVRLVFIRWRGGGWGWLVVGVFLAFGVRLVFIRWRGGGWCLFAFGFGVVGWWWDLLACGGPVFARWIGGWH